MGGGFAIAVAPKGAFAAAAPNYGMVPRHAEGALAGAYPFVASYGKSDWMMRGQARRLDDALDSLGVPHDVKEYPGATHSFLSHHSGGLVEAMDRITGIRHSPEAAEDAWARILGFFEHRLGPRGAVAGPGWPRHPIRGQHPEVGSDDPAEFPLPASPPGPATT